LEFGGPLVTKEYYEHICAISVIILILRALFMNYIELSAKWFEIQSNYTNNHLFDSISFYKKLKEPIVLAEFSGSLCNNKTIEDDTVKLYRNEYRVLNELAAKTKNGQVPNAFIVLFHQAKLRLKGLKLIDDCTCIRINHAKVRAPASPEEIQGILT
jgi:hypothetical protein